jgi:antitoxin FitA
MPCRYYRGRTQAIIEGALICINPSGPPIRLESESFRLTAINASIWSVKELELPYLTAEEASVAQLIVRDLSEDLVKALKQRAAKRNRSTEQEHREILQWVLRGPKRRHLADVLAAIPNVGEDSDFGREQTDKRG